MRRSFAFALGCALVSSVFARAQDINLGAPHTNIGDSFYESFGVRGAYNGPGVSFSWGGPVNPPFGNFVPGEEAQFGFNAGGLSLGFSAAQGSDRSSVSQTPMLTIPNGGSGVIFDGSIQPFVTAFVPVVGDDGRVYGGGNTMLDDRWSRLQAGERPVPFKPQIDQSPVGREAPLRLGSRPAGAGGLPGSGTSAEVAVASVEAQRAAFLASSREEANARRREFQETLDRAAAAAERGKKGLAKAYLDQAARNAADEGERAEALARMQALGAAP